MSDIKFGAAGWNEETPKPVRRVFKAILYITGLWALLSPMLTDFSDETRGDIDHWCLVGLTVLRFTAQFFHWDLENNG